MVATRDDGRTETNWPALITSPSPAVVLLCIIPSSGHVGCSSKEGAFWPFPKPVDVVPEATVELDGGSSEPEAAVTEMGVETEQSGVSEDTWPLPKPDAVILEATDEMDEGSSELKAAATEMGVDTDTVGVAAAGCRCTMGSGTLSAEAPDIRVGMGRAA